MSKRSTMVALAVAAVATTGLASTVTPSSQAEGGSAGKGAAATRVVTAPTGSIALVQAVPETTMSVTIDGKSVATALAEGKVLEPLNLSVGDHTIVFTPANGDAPIASTVTVEKGRSSDVVVHDPAAVNGDPAVSVYPTPKTALGPGKARVLLAHTATTAPADVRLDGKTVFTNISNGEFAEAEVGAGTHTLSLQPSGFSGGAILGPLTLTLKAGTVTTVYAVGNPRMNSMNAIVRTTTLSGHQMVMMANRLRAPSTIETGSAGLVGDRRIHTFSLRP